MKKKRHTLIVTTDGRKKFASAASLAAQHDLGAKERAALAALKPGETLKLKADDGKTHVVERAHARGGSTGRRLRRAMHELRRRGLHHGIRRHRFARPAEHAVAVADLDAAYRAAKKQYHRLGEELFASKASTK